MVDRGRGPADRAAAGGLRPGPRRLPRLHGPGVVGGAAADRPPAHHRPVRRLSLHRRVHPDVHGPGAPAGRFDGRGGGLRGVRGPGGTVPAAGAARVRPPGDGGELGRPGGRVDLPGARDGIAGPLDVRRLGTPRRHGGPVPRVRPRPGSSAGGRRSMSAVTLALVGAGLRGRTYARHAVATGEGRVVAVAEADPRRRAAAAAEFQVPAQQVYAAWSGLAAVPRLADAAIVATQDRMHRDPAVALAGLGYHILLEKPMAPTEQDAADIADAA